MHSVPILTHQEADVFLDINDIEPSPPIGYANSKCPAIIRASVLQRVILGQPVKLMNKRCSQTIPIPSRGLRLRNLKIVGDSYEKYGHLCRKDKTGELNLQDACGPNNATLAPLDLKSCHFPYAIRMSRARFRSLSLEDSRLTHLRANGIRVEGTLNLSHIRPFWSHNDRTLSHDSEEWFVDDDSDASMPLLPVVPIRRFETALNRLLPNLPSALMQTRLEESFDRNGEPIPPDDCRWSLDDVVREKIDTAFNGSINLEQLGLCWLELRNSTIGIDLDISSSIVVAPRQDRTLTNSAHARHAVDLRGSHIHGRFTFSPSHLKQSPPTVALGGISILRATIDGSVCGSGALLIAVEGCALAASRVTIRSQLFLDYSWEGQKGQWTRFRAYGFIDLTAAKVGASIYMNGTYLGRDSFARAGLVASQLDVGNTCYLCATEVFDLLPSDSNPPSEVTTFVPFESLGGVSLDKAVIHGDLDMNGASLQVNPFGKALYAPGLSVTGTARLAAYPMLPTTIEKSPERLPFKTAGPIVLAAATLKKDLNMWGCCLSPAAGLWSKKALNADLINVRGCIRIASDSDPWESFALLPLVIGTISIRNAEIGMELVMKGARFVSSMGSCLALDLSGTHIRSKVSMEWSRFDGTLRLQDSTIDNQLILIGAQLWPDRNQRAIEALNLHVASMVKLGDPFTVHGPVCSKKFSSYGCLDFTNATMPVGLWMNDIQVTGSFISTNDAKHRQFALVAPSATITRIEMKSSTFVGHLKLKNLSASDIFHAEDTRIMNGVLDLWEASLGELKLNRCAIQGSTSKQAEKWERDDILHLSHARIDADMLINLENTEKLWTSSYKGDRFANLRDLKVGSLSDQRNKGWSSLKLKVQGFNTQTLPNRINSSPFPIVRIVLSGVFSVELYFIVISLFRKANDLWYLCFLVPLWAMIVWIASDLPRLWRRLVKVLWNVEIKGRISHDPHVDWLNRQDYDEYREDSEAKRNGIRKKKKRQLETTKLGHFVPSSYDHLAGLLRAEGHDLEADRILRAKFWKRMEHTRPLESIFWYFYGRIFGFGLSSLATVSTLLVCLSLGIFASHKASSSHVLKEVASNPVAVKEGAANPVAVKPVAVKEVTANPVATELADCKDVDATVYAIETFIPELKFVSPKACEIVPPNTGNGTDATLHASLWRAGRTLYISIGWIVTSITILAIPGFLRKRAEG